MSPLFFFQIYLKKKEVIIWFFKLVSDQILEIAVKVFLNSIFSTKRTNSTRLKNYLAFFRHC